VFIVVVAKLFVPSVVFTSKLPTPASPPSQPLFSSSYFTVPVIWFRSPLAIEQSSTKVANGGISVKFAAAYWASSTQMNWRLGLFWTDKFGLEQLPPNISLLPFLRV